MLLTPGKNVPTNALCIFLKSGNCYWSIFYKKQRSKTTARPQTVVFYMRSKLKVGWCITVVTLCIAIVYISLKGIWLGSPNAQCLKVRNLFWSCLLHSLWHLCRLALSPNRTQSKSQTGSCCPWVAKTCLIYVYHSQMAT